MIEAVNLLCDKILYIRYADNMVRKSQAFLHFFSQDGLEVAASTMCDTNQCPTCTVPHDMLDNTEQAFPIRDMETVMESVKKASEKMLDEHKQVKEKCKTQVTKHIL